MPTVTVAVYGSTTFTGPFNSTDDYKFFATSVDDSGATQVLDRWRYVGQHGQSIKKMGLGMRAGSITGWIDASSVTNLATGKDALEGLVNTCTPGNLVIYTNETISNVVFSTVVFPSHWGHDTRYCANFVITWESTGG